MTKIKKIISILLITLLLIGNIPFGIVYAAPEPPTAPEAPTPPPQEDSAPTAPETPTNEESPPPAPEAPTAPETPTQEEALNPTPEARIPEVENTNQDSNSPISEESEDDSQPFTSSSGPDMSQLGGVVADKNLDGAFVQTGDATSTAVSTTTANTNASASVAPEGSGGIKVLNDNNLSSSDNNGSASISSDNNTFQNNGAIVGNSLSQTTLTGENSTSFNGGDNTIKTGDANTTGTLISGVNTNAVSVSEFNIDDTQTGDVVLDFAANCISGCQNGGDLTAKNSNNGADSTNNATIDSASNEGTFQNNDAAVDNQMTLSANSGDNVASKNTGGDNFIQTGDANVSANALTFANNNLAGNVVFGVVNIFGTLIGDIILPESEVGGDCSSCSGESLTASNTNNGADSTNNANIDQNTSDSTFQTNDASISNAVNVDSETGDNSVSKNTGGDQFVETGNATVDVNTLNIANSNIDSGDTMWLVIVNKAGEWFGQLLGAPAGALFAGGEGTEFSVNENGEITATNNGNLAGSDNNASVTDQTNTTTIQTNNATINNTLNLSANTGGNQMNDNGGDNTIKTGDATIVANLVNFVNNNIKGGKLVVLFVNVFGTWIGDFVTPGQEQRNHADSTIAQASQDSAPNNPPVAAGIGGTQPQSENQSQQNQGQSQSQTSAPSVPLPPQTNGGLSNGAFMTATFDFAANAGSVMIASAQTKALDVMGVNAQKQGKKSISINLAWTLLLLPIVGAFVIFKKRYYLSIVLPRLLKKALPR